MMPRDKILSWLILVAAVVLIAGCSRNQTPAPAPRLVSVAKVTSADVPLYLDEIGTCAASQSVQVQAQVSGQIVSRDFEDGADVKKGDPLFTIDQRPYQAVLDSAKADLILAQANLKRQEELKAKAVTAETDLDTARANAMRAQAAVDAAQVNLDYCSIRSPIDGRAGLRQVDVGNTVTVGTGGAVLVTIDTLDPIYTDFTVAEPDLPLVRQHLGGPNVSVVTTPEDPKIKRRTGKLYFIATTLQPGAGTVQARAITDNPDHALWPSQFVHVRLVLDILKNAQLVLNEAVQIGENGPYIFVVKPDSTLELRQVKSGQRQGNNVVVSEGVKVGETVVVRGQLQLAPGTKIVAQEEKSAPNEKSSDGSGSASVP